MAGFRTQVMEEASWETLSPPLLELILERLPIPDYLRFASVCSSWYRIQLDHRVNHTTSPPYKPQMPWLLLPGGCQERLFYSLSEQRCYRLSKGLGMDICHLPCLHSKVELPGIPYLCSSVEAPQGIPFICSRVNLLQGMLPSVPTNPDSIDVMWNHKDTTFLSFRRVRDESWTTHLIQGCFTGNPVYLRGKFYMLSSKASDEVTDGRKLVVVDTLSSPALSYIDMKMGLPMPVSIVNLKFLVECDGQILLVRLSVEGSTLIGTDVFKADLSEKAWVRLESLGDHVLFLAGWHSFSMPASNTGGPGNHIYFSWLMKDKLFIGYNYGNQNLIGVNVSDLPHSVRHNLLSQHSLGLWPWVVQLL